MPGQDVGQIFLYNTNYNQKGWIQPNNLPDGFHQTPPTADDASWDQPETYYRTYSQNAQVQWTMVNKDNSITFKHFTVK